MLKGLRQFVPPFDCNAFLTGKELVVTACKRWTDFDTKAILGTRLEVAIVKDETPYELGKNSEVISNLFEKLVIKIPKDISIPIGANVTLVNATGTIYGDYGNQLSIKADDVKAVSTTMPAKA